MDPNDSNNLQRRIKMTDSQLLNGLHIERSTAKCGKTELRICPESLHRQRIPRRTEIVGLPECRSSKPLVSIADSMVQFKLETDFPKAGFTAGVTLQDSSGVDRLERQENLPRNGSAPLVTRFEDKQHGLTVEQHLQSTKVEGTLLAWTTITNRGDQSVSLEYLSSFVLSGLTPFASDNAANRLRVHRFRSWWSNEGRLLTESLEDLHLERSWSGCKLLSERFGQVGTMPVRKFFPFVAVEDTKAGVIWGAQLAWGGSWQMEITRRGDSVSISGGLADHEFGHWKKTLQPGETLTTPVAHLACIQGELSDLTSKLVELQESNLSNAPADEDSLPVVFNEWCTNWGAPSHDKTIAIAERLMGVGIRYLVVDDGWAKRPAEATMQSNGDWILDTAKFPNGIDATCQELREMGFTPGIWFEFEVCNPGSEAFQQTEHHLQRNGHSLRIGDRRFWDLNDPWVIDYLQTKLIGFLKDNQFGYLKIDYNDSIGLGCDHPDSLGEGLRQQVNGLYAILDRIREQLPELVIESCSSGGHRLEPSIMQRTSMSSFSDAHESWNIPIIARQLQHLLPPRQSQIWAVLYPEDSLERMFYSLTATLYGRMCLSGPVHDLSDEQMEIVKHAVSFYQKAAAFIKSGKTTFLGATPKNWTNPEGWSGIWRESSDHSQALIVIHTYDALPDQPIEVRLPKSACRKTLETLHDGTTSAPRIQGDRLIVPKGKPFRGFALLLGKQTD